MSITLITLTTPKPGGSAALEHYLAVVQPLMQRACAKVIAQYQTHSTIAGDTPPQFIATVQYPDQSALDLVFQSDEYKALTPVIEQAFTNYTICRMSA